MNFKFFYSVILFSFFIFSCKTIPKNEALELEEPERITLLFAGDIMAHRPNFNMKNYHKIWENIKPIVSKADFSFANIEAPVDQNLPFSPYPNFNMQPSYPEAAIDAGFNVFSLVNNHTNDQGLEGILETRKWGIKIEENTKNSERPVYFCGINETPNQEISYKIIQHGQWKILFVAVTEILNRPNYRSYLNYVVASKKNWEIFSEYLVQLRENNPCDIMVLAIHTDEPEYVLPVAQKRKDFYHNLALNGVDVIWANHPHIVREREFIGDKETKLLKNAIIYGNGNTISGQRWEPALENPANPRDDTGDGMMMELVFRKDKQNPRPYIEKTETYFITTYINTAWEFVIRFLDDDFIQYLNSIGRTKWAEYIQARKKIIENIKETTIWQ
ncbi:MAG: CapA family protein [Treponema sp.]|nr:CapA family protein [Treponema sp.]